MTYLLEFTHDVVTVYTADRKRSLNIEGMSLEVMTLKEFITSIHTVFDSAYLMPITDLHSGSAVNSPAGPEVFSTDKP